MISHYLVQQFLKSLAPAFLLLICCSVAGLAQSVEVQELGPAKQTISFKDVSMSVAIEAVAKQLKLNVVFDDTVKKNDKLTIELRDVTLEQTLKIFLVAKGLQARIIEENTIIVFPDNADNRQRYGQYELWPAKSDGR